MATGYEPAKAYHAYTALFYCVGIAGVYLLVRIGVGSRGAAWLAAGVTALLLPSYLRLKDFRADGAGLRGCRARLRQPGGGSDESAGDQRTMGGYARPGSRAWHAVDAMPGVDAVYVSGRGSREPYKDSLNPEKFAGVLPVLYDDHQGNVIYRVPRRWPAPRVVDTSHLDSLHPS
jgi:hypothetical protein